MMCLRARGQIAGVCFAAAMPGPGMAHSSVNSATYTIEPGAVLALPAVTQALDSTSRLVLPSYGLAFVEVRPH